MTLKIRPASLQDVVAIMEIENSSPKSSEIDPGDYYDQSEEYCSAYEDEVIGLYFVILEY